MTTLELKAKILQDIDNEQDNVILEKIQKYYRKLKKAKGDNMPCQYTLDELKGRLARGKEEADNGGGIEHEEFMKEVETWF
ncbi:hypothetical protein [Massilibacteroides vaginae]|uniref:hypothetical protein n=1 Tax=Massilibacteroides vaginae TaxID=1673718 RepID=UPI000A1CE56A|nr:hypothetical protein [Massilibacteroides vaginae]